MPTNSCARAFGNTNNEKESASDHQKNYENKSSAAAIGGPHFIAHLLKTL